MAQKIIIYEWGRWLSLKKAALYCGFSPTQLRRFIHDGILNVVRIQAGHPRVDRLELDKLFERYKFNYKVNEERILNKN